MIIKKNYPSNATPWLRKENYSSNASPWLQRKTTQAMPVLSYKQKCLSKKKIVRKWYTHKYVYKFSAPFISLTFKQDLLDAFLNYLEP